MRKSFSASLITPLALLLLFQMPSPGSPESQAVLDQFGPLEWIGGTNIQEASNGNGWSASFEGSPATSVNLSEPHSAMGDLSGRVYVADKNAHAIRVIEPDGTIRTVAGNNTPGFDGDGPATSRQLNGPQNAYVLPDGTFYILDTNNRRIRKVDAQGMMTSVVIESATLSRGLWVRRDGGLVYYCTQNSLRRWTPAMGTNPGTVMANGFSELGNIDVAANGDIYLTDRGANSSDPTFSQVFRIAPDATPQTFIPVAVAGTGGTANSGPEAEGSPAILTGLSGVRAIAFHPAGGYFLATHRGGDVWYVDASGTIAMVVQGNDGNAAAPDLLPRTLPATGSNIISEVRSVSVSLTGDLLIATNDAGFILRAKYQGPSPAPALAEPLHPAVPGGPAGLQWTQEIGSWFRIESTENPATSPWAVRLTGTATGQPQSWLDPESTSTQPRQFYRVRRFRAWPN